MDDQQIQSEQAIKSNSWKYFILGILVILILVIAGGVIIWLKQPKSNPHYPNPPAGCIVIDYATWELDCQGLIYSEIKNIIQTNASDISSCKLIPVGHAPCGGPASYEVYSSESTDVDLLEQLASQHYEAAKKYNEQSGAAGICMITTPPKIDLIDGHCVPTK